MTEFFFSLRPPEAPAAQEVVAEAPGRPPAARRGGGPAPPLRPPPARLPTRQSGGQPQRALQRAQDSPLRRPRGQPARPVWPQEARPPGGDACGVEGRGVGGAVCYFLDYRRHLSYSYFDFKKL